MSKNFSVPVEIGSPEKWKHAIDSKKRGHFSDFIRRHGRLPRFPLLEGESVLFYVLRKEEEAMKLWHAWQSVPSELHGSLPSKGLSPRHYQKNLHLLLSAGVCPEVKGLLGSTPLLEATGMGSVESVKNLLAAGARPDTSLSHGTSPLHHAVLSGRSGVVRLLLKAGTPLSIKNVDGNTPLHLAGLNPNQTILRMLHKAGADWSLTNARNQTPVDIIRRTDPLLAERWLHRPTQEALHRVLPEKSITRPSSPRSRM